MRGLRPPRVAVNLLSDEVRLLADAMDAYPEEIEP